MDVLVKTKPQEDSVYKFLDKKRAQGKPYYVKMAAGVNKSLRIYYVGRKNIFHHFQSLNNSTTLFQTSANVVG